ncbi:hypothetical protein PENTCL1PPCAC_24488, partial [Pristionchus entomophagus]
MRVENVVYLAYGLPCIAIYVLVVVSIISLRRELSRSFVVIFLLDAFMNLITYLNTWFTLRLKAEKAAEFLYIFFNDSVVIPYIQNFLTGYCYYGQNITSFLLTLDRFVSIVYGTHVEAISLIRIRKLKYQSKLDRSFFIISFCIFVAQSFNIIVVFLFSYYFVLAYDAKTIGVLNSILTYTSDIFSLGPAMYHFSYTLLVPGPISRRCISLLTRRCWCRPALPVTALTTS